MLVRILFALMISAVCLMIAIMLKYPEKTTVVIPGKLNEKLESKQFEDWTTFNSAIGRFQVELPVLPQHASEELPVAETDLTIRYEMYVAEETDGTIYMVSMVDYPDEMDTSDPDAILENVMNEQVLSNPENKLKSLNYGYFKTHRSLNFFIKNPDLVICSRAFIVDKKLYLLTLVDYNDTFSEETFSYFVDSFKFFTP